MLKRIKNLVNSFLEKRKEKKRGRRKKPPVCETQTFKVKIGRGGTAIGFGDDPKRADEPGAGRSLHL